MLLMFFLACVPTTSPPHRAPQVAGQIPTVDTAAPPPNEQTKRR